MYTVFDKINECVVDSFSKFWEAEELIPLLEIPEGYIYARDVYVVLDDNGNEAQAPEEERKPYFISHLAIETAKAAFDPAAVSFDGDIHVYERFRYFDTEAEALEALKEYKSNKITHKGYNGDLIAAEQYFVEHKSKGIVSVVKISEYSEKDYDFRGGSIYQEYDCYGKLESMGQWK